MEFKESTSPIKREEVINKPPTQTNPNMFMKPPTSPTMPVSKEVEPPKPKVGEDSADAKIERARDYWKNIELQQEA